MGPVSPRLRTAIAVAVVLAGIQPSPAAPRERGGDAKPVTGVERHAPPASDRFLESRRPWGTTANPATTFLGAWDFDSVIGCDAEGWTPHDASEDTERYFHVADTTQLDGGGFGRLVPLRGDKSLWCGLPPSATAFPQCGWSDPPGYGNLWNQLWQTKACVDLTEDGALTYVFTHDAEVFYDATYVEVSRCGEDNWVLIDGGRSIMGPGFDGRIVDSTQTSPIFSEFDSTSIEIRFRFNSDGAFSDEDGFYAGDGGVLIDSLMVTDASGVLVPLEDFEDETDGALETQDWYAVPLQTTYGDYAGLFVGSGVLQEDDCVKNLSCFWAFFEGSAYDYACGGHPEQMAVPYGNTAIGYIDNEVWSPWIAWNGTGNVAWLEFDVYRDLAFDNRVFYTWGVREMVDGCVGRWKGPGVVFEGDEKDWYRHRQDFGALVDPAATHVQISIGVVNDLFMQPPPSECHSQAPLVDNVLVYREPFSGPTWDLRDRDLFQDTFPRDGSLTGTGRADMAADPVHGPMDPEYFPGDSAVVHSVVGAAFPFTSDSPYFFRAVYCFVSVSPPDTAKAGAHLANTNLLNGLPRFAYVGMANAGGREWTQLNCDRRRNAAGTPLTTTQYCIDLPDDLFEAGDTIEYFFGARNEANEWSYWTRETGTVYTIGQAAAAPLEFQILPGAAVARGSDILYIDGMDGLGAQPYFDTALQQLDYLGKVDRFDINAPSAALSNRLGTRVYHPDQLSVYHAIVWNTGDLPVTIGDGTGNPEKSDDWLVLDAWLDGMATYEETGGIWLTGDDIPSVWAAQTGASAIAMRDWLHYSVPPGGDNHAPLVGVSPYGVGTTIAGSPYGDPFSHPNGPDTLVAFGGCPGRKDFDYMNAEGAAFVCMTYEGAGASAGAIVEERTAAGAGNIAVLLSGFSFHSIRDDRPSATMDRVIHMAKSLREIGPGPFGIPVGTQSGPRYAYSLAQNYPNPFNPTTTIAFTVKERTRVRLNIYNVAGALVRRLVDDQRSPGITHTVVWDGRNSAGQPVASGVYFYRLEAKDFTRTRKMVVLK